MSRPRLTWGSLGLAAAMALAACAPTPTWTDPTPPRQVWQPAGPATAQLVLVHGMNDHGGSFAEFAQAAAARGILVRAYDQPGFGAAENRYRWPGGDRLVAALRGELTVARTARPDLPLYVLGVSMGGTVATLALAGPDAPKVDGLILAAPAVHGEEGLPPAYARGLALADATVPALPLDGRGLTLWPSDDLGTLRSLSADPLVLKRTRVDAIAGLVEAMDEASAAAPALRPRRLILVGLRDQFVPPKAQLAFARRAAAGDCRAALYPNGWHLLLRDQDRAVVWDDVLAFMAKRQLPSRFDRPCTSIPADDPLLN